MSGNKYLQVGPTVSDHTLTFDDSGSLEVDGTPVAAGGLSRRVFFSQISPGFLYYRQGENQAGTFRGGNITDGSAIALHEPDGNGNSTFIEILEDGDYDIHIRFDLAPQTGTNYVAAIPAFQDNRYVHGGDIFLANKFIGIGNGTDWQFWQLWRLRLAAGALMQIIYTVSNGSGSEQVGDGSLDIMQTQRLSGFQTPAYVIADTPGLDPLTVVEGVNDTFVYTPVASGIPDTFTIAPDTYTGLNVIAAAVRSAVNGDAVQFGTLVNSSFSYGTVPNGGARASVVASSAPTLPLTIATGVNDTFHYTPNAGWDGSVETFTMANGTVCNTLTNLQECAGAATGSVSSEPFSTYVAVTNNATELVFTAQKAGASENGNKIAEGNGGAAALGITSPPAIFGAGGGAQLALSVVEAGDEHNGDAISAGITDVSVDLGFVQNPNIFAGGQ